MKAYGTKKINYALIVIAVLIFAILFGFLFDLVLTQIEKLIYPCPEEYSAFVETYAREYGVPEELVWAVIKTESGFDSSAVSHKGAVGLMQMMPETFEWLTNDILHDNHEVGMLYDPETNTYVTYGTLLNAAYGKFLELKDQGALTPEEEKLIADYFNRLYSIQPKE